MPVNNSHNESGIVSFGCTLDVVAPSLRKSAGHSPNRKRPEEVKLKAEVFFFLLLIVDSLVYSVLELQIVPVSDY